MRTEGELAGMVYGVIGVVAFSLTLPTTRIAVAELDPVFVGLGRAVVAALIAAAALLLTGQRWPTSAEWRGLIIVAGGCVLGFPLLSALALTELPAAHGAVVVGVMPLATAAMAALSGSERPSAGFWLAGVLGSALVVAYALRAGGIWQAGDSLMLLAVLLGAAGYAVGGRLARTLGGWQVIAWALVLSAPFMLPPVALAVSRHGLHGSATTWACFAYVSLVSQFLGFVFWYKGLALGGVARVSQTQLLQPFLTVLAAAWLAAEPLSPVTVGFALAVSLTVAVGRKMAVARHG